MRSLWWAGPVLALAASSCVVVSDDGEPAGTSAGNVSSGGSVGNAGNVGSSGTGDAGTGNGNDDTGGAGTGGSDNQGNEGGENAGGSSNAGAGGEMAQGGLANGGNANDDDAGMPTDGDCVEPAEMEGITEAHNAVRDSVEPPNQEPLPPLTWSCEVAEIAQAYAEELAAMGCPLMHSQGDYGENLYWSSGFEPSPQDVVDAWASEEPCYSYDVFPDQCTPVPDQCDVCGHYTQMVWRNTELVGCGMARCGDEQVWVCNYDPPGNYINQMPY